MMNLLDHVSYYEPDETGVGCAEHHDATCLCDVIVTDPVPIRFALGRDKGSVLFSESVSAVHPVRDELIPHLCLLLGVYDASTRRRGQEKITPLVRAERQIALVDGAEYNPMARTAVKFTAEDEVWLRKDIPHTWCAAALGLERIEAVAAWREANGIVITRRGRLDMDRILPRSRSSLYRTRTGRRQPFNKWQGVIANHREIVTDTSLSLRQAAAKAGVSQTIMFKAREALGVKTGKSGKPTAVDWHDPKVIAVLEGNFSERDGARALGVSPTAFGAHRRQHEATLAKQNEGRA